MNVLRRRWKGIVICVACCLALVILLVAIPLITALHWRTAITEAAAAGLPTSIAELGMTADPARHAAAVRLLALRGKVHLVELRPGAMGRWSTQAPPDLAAMWAKNDPAVIAAALADLDIVLQTPPECLPPPMSREWSDRWSANRFAGPFLVHLWYMTPANQRASLASRLIDRLEHGEPSTVAASPWSKLHSAPIERLLLDLLASSTATLDRSVATRLRRFADDLPERARRLNRERFVFACDAMRDFRGFARSHGVALPGILESRIGSAAVIRLGGGRLLRDAIAWNRVLTTGDDPRAHLAALASAFAARRNQRLPEPAAARILSECVATHLYPVWPSYAMQARLIAWAIDGQEWPIDLWDPAHGALRRIERDGVVVGAYSVGRDGVDDGGGRDDDRLLLVPDAP